MRVRLSLSFEVVRAPKPEPELHEHRDTDSVVEQIGQPRYAGFAIEEPPLEVER